MANKQAEILNDNGLMLYEDGEYDKALDDFNEALLLDKGYTDCYINRGNVFLKKEEFQKALDDFNAAIELKPNGNEALSGRARAYLNLKEYDKALEDINLALKIKPFNTDYKNLKGEILIKQGESEMSSNPVINTAQKSRYQYYKDKLSEFTFEDEVKETIYLNLEELERIEHVFDSNSVSLQSWFEWIIKLPWKDTWKEENYTLSEAMKILEEEHYGLQDVKTRIIEYLAVHKKKKDSRGAIICLSGPPGVGKTSVGKSIARAMNKEFFRFSVGGVHSETAIRGSHRVWVGAQPGPIIKALAIKKTKSLVCLIDEVDKMNPGAQGDPYAALLEVLDPEQNNSFRDNFIDLPFDLSKILFILTANNPYRIPEALRDRLEFINIPGYINIEKLTIAKNYLVPKTLERCGLQKDQVTYSDDALLHIANGYAFEPGVRNMEKNLDKIHRKMVRTLVEADENKTKKTDLKFSVNTRKDVETYLGKLRYNYDKDSADLLKADRPGMAVGLFVLEGSIGITSLVEAIAVPGDEGFTITGNMEESVLMKESVKAAFSYTQKLAIEQYKVNPEWFKKNHIHLHFPTPNPKDGNSAGITIATAFLSLFRNKTITDKVVMTGEITLTRQVLAIGGLKEKLIGAKQNQAEHIIFPKQNLSDLDEIPDVVKEGITFHPVERFEEILALILPE